MENKINENTMMEMIKTALPKAKQNSSESSESSISSSDISDNDNSESSKHLTDISNLKSSISKFEKGKVKLKNMAMNVGDTVKYF